MICALIPPIIHLQDDAMDLVVNSATSTGGSLQFALAAQLRRVGTSCNTLYKAASSRDLLTPNGVLEPWQFLAWTSGLIADNGYSISLIRPDGRGYVLAPDSTVVDGSALPGYVFISRITDPGVGMDYGFFRVGVPPTPANLTSPWTNLSTTVSWVDQPMYHKLISDVNRTSVMAWTSLSPRNSSRASSSLLSYGGHFTVPTAIDNASRTQILSINLRGEALSDFFSTVPFRLAASIHWYCIGCRNLWAVGAAKVTTIHRCIA
ncbi:Hypothetical protein, putative [Bodo saltans]|uniref:Uncharacterized protein n=1 Tax=Bodo saltans TaxID=75058 RepID=A0A0S4JLB5_BODSA|nr:Hypothetical protein, putative [Bodo saltans]|eukprot:CUG90975.1 Hypothetical protein, putative [Bodo saltans]